jgi:8-oxo-dGTP pyrophosphatase MutT (NUDIX family)
MPRHTRYQGLIVNEDKVLLIKHRKHATGEAYWVIPGGGLEAGETESQCVVREMKEETNLDVAIDRLLLDEPAHPGGIYRRRKSYLCRPVSGTAAPGYEPEPDAAASYAITEVRWFDLSDERAWEEALRNDPITYPQLVKLREALGYA